MYKMNVCTSELDTDSKNTSLKHYLIVFIVPEASSQSALQSHPPGHCAVFYRDHSPGGGLFVVDRIHRCPGKEISNDQCTRHCLVLNSSLYWASR